MAIDESFKKPGSVPFKWEIRPGVPKIQHHQQKLKQTPQPPPSRAVEFANRRLLSPVPPQKLKSPTAVFQFFQPLESRSQSFRSAPRTRSWHFEKHCIRPECVSPGCFPTPLLLRRKGSKKRILVPRPESEPGHSSELETSLTRWSVSSRKSLSPFTASPASSSFSSYKSSPRPVVEAEWAGFGFF